MKNMKKKQNLVSSGLNQLDRTRKLFGIRHQHKAGDAPGTAHFVGRQKVEQATISLMEYTAEEIREEHNLTTLPDYAKDLRLTGSMFWACTM